MDPDSGRGRFLPWYICVRIICVGGRRDGGEGEEKSSFFWDIIQGCV